MRVPENHSSSLSTNLLSWWFHLDLFGLSGFLDVLWCQSGNYCVMDRSFLIVDPVGAVEEASTLSRPARPHRTSTCGWRKKYEIEWKKMKINNISPVISVCLFNKIKHKCYIFKMIINQIIFNYILVPEC